MIISPKLKNLTENESIELAKILCSSKSSFQDDANEILQTMIERGLSDIEAKKIISVFNSKINNNINLKENIYNTYNLGGINQITYIVINYVLAASNNPVISYFCDQEIIDLLSIDLNQQLSSLDKIEDNLNNNKICLINNQLFHPYKKNLDIKKNKEALLIKSLINVTNVNCCIAYCFDEKITQLAIQSMLDMEFKKILLIYKSENTLKCHIYENEEYRYFEVNSMEYNVKLTQIKNLEIAETASMIKAICMGYNSVYKEEINLLSGIILNFIGKAIDINEGIGIAKSVFENNKIINLIKLISKE